MEQSIANRKAHLLVNTRSLMGSEWFERAQSLLAESDIELLSAKGFSKAGDLIRTAKDLIENDEFLIVGGGDGTISAVAGLATHKAATLGVLPLGTGNAFARDLGIPTDLEKAIQIIVEGKREQVDVGIANGVKFVNVATIGLTTEIAKTLTVPMKRRFGRFVYAIALANALQKMRPFQVNISTENGDQSLEAVQVVLGNGHYHGGPLPLSPTSAITSGKLRLYAVQATSKLDLLKYALLLPTGFQGVLSTVHSEATVGGKLVASPSQQVVIDGELGQSTPLEFSIEPLALNVIVPKTFVG